VIVVSGIVAALPHWKKLSQPFKAIIELMLR
jgi:hypothetical protein